jgi:UDP-N-acetylmuramate dehydrogenase
MSGLKRREVSVEDKLEVRKPYPASIGPVFLNPDKGKVSQMIEESGLNNVRLGKARVSPEDGNYILNEGDVTAKDIKGLIGLIRDKVKEKFGILLKFNIKVIDENNEG